MSQKDTDEPAKVVTDTNQDGMPLPPPPSYANSAGANSAGGNSAAANAKYSPPAGGYPPSSQPYYQAQPVGVGSSGSQQYAPPAGAPPNTGYASSPHPSAHYIPPPAGGAYAPPPGYLFGMCFMNSPDPRERWWARMCAIMCIIWSLIIIFAAIFGR
ncbi:hypothetical protein BGZ72_005360 [Mortierella alpina]|nr:hypothetical protein BGZ72_005360 [Mortierella alpina]